MADSWQLIKTAPKDGTCVLAVNNDKHPTTGRPFVPFVMWWKDGWRIEADDDPMPMDWPWPPTHWQPLPDPPSMKDEGHG